MTLEEQVYDLEVKVRKLEKAIKLLNENIDKYIQRQDNIDNCECDCDMKGRKTDSEGCDCSCHE